MAVGRISGPLLKANLERNGINLAVETDLLYIDVNTQRIGINNSSPQDALDVAGTARSTVVQTGLANIDNVTINDSTITTFSSNLILTGATTTDQVQLNDLAFTQNEFTTVTDGDDILINTRSNGRIIINSRLSVPDASVVNGSLNYGTVSIIGEPTFAEISTNISGLDLNIDPAGTGRILLQKNTEVLANLDVTGNIAVDGNVTIGGNLTIGDQDTDSITIAADFTSNIKPDVSDTYDIGTSTKKWRDGYVGDLLLTSNSLSTSVTDQTIRITPDGTGTVIMDTTTAMRVPIGTTAQRPSVTDPGYLRWNSTDQRHEGWDGFLWRQIPFGQVITRHFFTATSGQTTFSGNDDTNTEYRIEAGTEIVTKNGLVLEKNEEYSTTNTTLTLVDPADDGDEINIISFGTYTIGDFVPQSTGGTFNGGITVGGNLSVLNNATVEANLVVNGASTRINSTSTAFVDRIVSIGTGLNATAPASDDNQDRGINFKWHDGTSAKNGFFGFDDSTGYFTFVPDATISGEIVTGAFGDIRAENFRGNVISPTISTTTLTVTGTTQLDGRLDVNSYASFNSTDAIKLPVGTTAERPSPLETGQVRFNTDLVTFEGYNGVDWGSIGGVIDTDRDTYVIAETSPGADNDQLEFYVAGIRELLVDASGLTLNQQLTVPNGGTGVTTFTTNGVLYGNSTSPVQVTAESNPGSNATTSYGILSTDVNNVPQWTDTIDGGSY